jgi:hypothetical protein
MKNKKEKIMTVKKICLCLTIGFCLVACAKKDTITINPTTNITPSNLQEPEFLTNFQFYEKNVDAMNEYGLFNELGFLPTGYRLTGYQVFDKKSGIQILYENGSEIITFRQSKTISSEKLNGDDNNYSSMIENVGGDDITLKTKNDKIYVAMWNKNNSNYCLMFSEGVDKETFEKIYKEII